MTKEEISKRIVELENEKRKTEEGIVPSAVTISRIIGLVLSAPILAIGIAFLVNEFVGVGIFFLVASLAPLIFFFYAAHIGKQEHEAKRIEVANLDKRIKKLKEELKIEEERYQEASKAEHQANSVKPEQDTIKQGNIKISGTAISSSREPVTQKISGTVEGPAKEPSRIQGSTIGGGVQSSSVKPQQGTVKQTNSSDTKIKDTHSSTGKIESMTNNGKTIFHESDKSTSVSASKTNVEPSMMKQGSSTLSELASGSCFSEKETACKLEDFELDEEAKTRGVIRILRVKKRKVTNVVIPEGVSEIDHYIFKNKKDSIRRVIVPSTMKVVPTHLFYGIRTLEYVEFKEGVEKLELDAFYSCENMEAVVIPSTISEMCGSLFGDFALGVTSPEYRWTYSNPVSVPNELIISPDNPYYGYDDNKIALYDKRTKKSLQVNVPYDEKTGISTIPPFKCLDKTVRLEINKNTSYLVISEGVEDVQCIKTRNYHLKEIHIPSTVKSFSIDDNSDNSGEIIIKVSPGNSVFKGTSDGRCLIKKEYDEATNSYEDVLVYAYRDVENIPSFVTKIGPNCFRNHLEIKSVTIPDSVKVIDNGAFSQCKNLTNIKFGNGLMEIGGSAFYGCDSLSSISLPDSLIVLRKYAFIYCGSLMDIKFGNSLQTIEERAFAFCKSLSSVDIPECVTEIESNTFAGCTKLEEAIISKAFEPRIQEIFGGCQLLLSTDGVTIRGSTKKKSINFYKGEITITNSGKFNKRMSLFLSGNPVEDLNDLIKEDCHDGTLATLKLGSREFTTRVWSANDNVEDIVDHDFCSGYYASELYKFKDCLPHEWASIETSMNSKQREYAYSKYLEMYEANKTDAETSEPLLNKKQFIEEVKSLNISKLMPFISNVDAIPQGVILSLSVELSDTLTMPMLFAVIMAYFGITDYDVLTGMLLCGTCFKDKSDYYVYFFLYAGAVDAYKFTGIPQEVYDYDFIGYKGESLSKSKYDLDMFKKSVESGESKIEYDYLYMKPDGECIEHYSEKTEYCVQLFDNVFKDKLIAKDTYDFLDQSVNIKLDSIMRSEDGDGVSFMNFHFDGESKFLTIDRKTFTGNVDVDTSKFERMMEALFENEDSILFDVPSVTNRAIENTLSSNESMRNIANTMLEELADHDDYTIEELDKIVKETIESLYGGLKFEVSGVQLEYSCVEAFDEYAFFVAFTANGLECKGMFDYVSLEDDEDGETLEDRLEELFNSDFSGKNDCFVLSSSIMAKGLLEMYPEEED